MALRKPLVLVNGQKVQLPAGDTLDASVAGSGTVSLANASTSPMAICVPAYMSSTGAKPAQANALSTSRVLGFVADPSIQNGQSGNFRTFGIQHAETTEWDAVMDPPGSGGLTPGAVYYLSSFFAGKIRADVPSSAGNQVVQVGVALTAQDMQILITDPVGL